LAGGEEMGASLGRVVIVGLALGLYMTALGWLGNNFLLGAEWDRAGELAANNVVLPYSDLTREIISLTFDFVFCLTMTWLYSKTADRSIGFSVKFQAVFWLATLVIFYVAAVNSRFVPWEIAWKTTVLGLAIAIPIVFLLPRLIPAWAPRAT
jgi:hypothetical protein